VHEQTPEIGDLVWVGILDTKAVQWIQDIYRKKTLIVVPVPKKYFMHHDPAYRWVWFEGKTHLAPLRYLKILSKKKNHELR